MEQQGQRVIEERDMQSRGEKNLRKTLFISYT
jgi:hypothetical protein